MNQSTPHVQPDKKIFTRNTKFNCIQPETDSKLFCVRFPAAPWARALQPGEQQPRETTGLEYGGYPYSKGVTIKVHFQTKGEAGNQNYSPHYSLLSYISGWLP